MATKNHFEDDEQKAFFQWADYVKELKWMHSSLNGASLAGDKIQRARQMNRLKSQGMKKGVLDVFLPKAKGIFHGMYLEMKFGKNTMTKEQKEFAIDIAAEGFCMFTCYNSEQAIEATKLYLNLKTGESIALSCPFLSANYT